MRVIVASTIVPFVEGGGTFIVDWLEEMLRRYGHEVEVFKIPFDLHHRRLQDQTMGLRLMNIEDRGDRLVAIRPPSHLLRHPNKVLWFIHHVREAYDLWNSPYCAIPHTVEGMSHRSSIFAADNTAFEEARNIFTNSAIVSRRLDHFNGRSSEVLYPPVLDPERFRCDSYGDFVLLVGRLARHKRIELAIEAMAHSRTSVVLRIAGVADEPAYESFLRERIEGLGLSGRVDLIARWISEEEKVRMLGDCLAVFYAPFEEDSYGYPSLEAHHSGKAVITAEDSGGTLELVEQGRNGLVVPPEPKAVGQAMDELWLDRVMAERMGREGRLRLDELGISWDRVIDRLLA